ncbi:MAG: hypothetical protein H6Q14_1923 [Bacteroidetes bacterium]|jgi:hypothetical protein|nr:hypothetical protein [Bacteroidota bacterium]
MQILTTSILRPYILMALVLFFLRGTVKPANSNNSGITVFHIVKMRKQSEPSLIWMHAVLSPYLWLVQKLSEEK